MEQLQFVLQKVAVNFVAITYYFLHSVTRLRTMASLRQMPIFLYCSKMSLIRLQLIRMLDIPHRNMKNEKMLFTVEHLL
jgi:hypothetical protein